MDENSGAAEPFENINIVNFTKCTKSPETEFQESDMKSTLHYKGLHMQFPGQWVPKFHLFHSTISHFKDNVHFRSFPLSTMLKFQSATKSFELNQMLGKEANIRIKFGNCMRSSILKFPAPCGPVRVNKIIKVP